MTYTLSPDYLSLRRNVQTYHLGFKHGWTADDLAFAESELKRLREENDLRYEEHVALMKAKQPPTVANPVLKDWWLRPVGVSQVHESGMIFDDSSQGIN